MEVWSSASFLSDSTPLQRICISVALLCCLPLIDSDEIEKKKDMFLSHMAHAARTTLNALCAEDQAPGLALLELCANAFIPSGVDALSFDYADTKETLLLKKIYKSTSKPLFCYLSPVIYNFIICTNNCEVPIDNPALEGVLEETFDPVGEYFDNNGSNSEKEHEISTSEDSSDDLTPYYIPEEEDLEEGQHKVNPPVHLRDCLAALQAVNDPDRLESALGACENLIRAHYPQRLQALIEVSVELAKILLHLQDDYSIENFTEMRIKSMVALTVFCPEKVATFLSTEFYAVNYSLQQDSFLTLFVLCLEKLIDVSSFYSGWISYMFLVLALKKLPRRAEARMSCFVRLKV
ncbi:telomere length regulation protein TEL2 homolog isoform X2 [Zophobas morio]|uniref:telomere length regulation protein TEL2 homolog isoform X2 n=1 Tax=Zophobas morio TaxID=2755281 RepID=UPI003082E0E4